MDIEPARPLDRTKVRLGAIVLTILLWGIYVLWRYPLIPDQVHGLMYRASPWVAVLLCIVPAYGLAVLVELIRANRHRLRALLRPNTGRILGAVALAFVTPVAVFGWLPWILGPFILIGISSGAVLVLLQALVVFLCVTLCWYPVSCLLVSGIQSRRWRFFMFCLMFWSGCALHILYMGVLRFSV